MFPVEARGIEPQTGANRKYLNAQDAQIQPLGPGAIRARCAFRAFGASGKGQLRHTFVRSTEQVAPLVVVFRLKAPYALMNRRVLRRARPTQGEFGDLTSTGGVSWVGFGELRLSFLYIGLDVHG